MVVLRRVGWGLVVLLGVSLITFTLAFVVPSDPARTVAGPKADPQTLARIRKDLRLDDPLPVQFARYVGRLMRGDLGRSYVTRRDVRAAILERVPATLFLASTSLALAVALGVALGVFTSLRAGTRTDLVVMTLCLVGLSVPVFFLGLLLLDLFAYRLRWLPLGGYGGVRFVVLPACALAIGNAAYYGRLVHTNMCEVLGRDYVRTARAKGLGPIRIYGRHALRNALLPVVTVIGLDFAGLMGGVVLTETVFNWPGLGRLAVDAVFNQDIPMIMGTVEFSALLVVAATLITDLLYVIIDPRIRSQP